MFDELQTEHEIENEQVVVILEAGSRWSSSIQRARQLAPNALFFRQDPEERPMAFAARVERRLRGLESEYGYGRIVRAAVLCFGPSSGADALAARTLLLRTAARTAADGCVFAISGSDHLTGAARRAVSVFVKRVHARYGSRIRLEFDVPRGASSGRHLVRSLGAAAAVIAFASVASAAPAAAPPQGCTGGFRSRPVPPEAGALRPGSFARVGFHVRTRSRLVVPTTAVTSFGAVDRVFVAGDRRASLRMITRGEARGPWTEVLSSLTAGERVVTVPPSDLRDGALVKAQP